MSGIGSTEPRSLHFTVDAAGQLTGADAPRPCEHCDTAVLIVDGIPLDAATGARHPATAARHPSYQSGIANPTSRVMHVVVNGPQGSYGEHIPGTAACGQPVAVRPTPLTPRHWVCVKCRQALTWGPNRTLQEMGEV